MPEALQISNSGSLQGDILVERTKELERERGSVRERVS